MSTRSAKLLVEIQLHESGGMQSSHRPSTEADRAELNSWPSGGLIHISQAMLVEALRREAYTMAITQLSLGKPLGSVNAKELADLTQAQVLKVMQDLIGPLAVETLDALRSAKGEKATDG